MNPKIETLVNLCQKPTSESLREILLCRQDFSQSENNFITYMAGFSHYEFAKDLLSDFNLSFIEGTSILFDKVSNKFHFKILINDQANRCGKLHMGKIDRNYNSFGSDFFLSYIAFRDKEGCYIDSLGKQIREYSLDERRAYITQGTSVTSENIVTYQRNLHGYCLVTHFVAAAQPNIDINIGNIFSRVTACIYANTEEGVYRNLSMYLFQDRVELYPLVKNIYWYVIDAFEAEKMVNLLQQIEADFKLVNYLDFKHDYLQEILPDIEDMVLRKIQNNSPL
jgi:hypothetical protein